MQERKITKIKKYNANSTFVQKRDQRIKEMPRQEKDPSSQALNESLLDTHKQTSLVAFSSKTSRFRHVNNLLYPPHTFDSVLSGNRIHNLLFAVTVHKMEVIDFLSPFRDAKTCDTFIYIVQQSRWKSLWDLHQLQYYCITSIACGIIGWRIKINWVESRETKTTADFL